MACPDESALLRYLAGDAREQASVLEAHVDGCRECRASIAVLARTSLGLPHGSAGEGAASRPDGPAPGEFLPAGAELGRYRIVRVRGQGGIGVVYEAEDPKLRRRVALKVLRGAVADVDAARLLAEARAMAKLSDPHVCPVLDIGAVHGRWFLAMALVEGGTLAEWLAAEERSTAGIVERFVEAGRGLQAAHRVGVVHRDFKPTNVLLDASGRALVSDFGLAIEMHAGVRGEGGTPHYMAPEQCEGRGDARVDQYAFGVALHDAFAGRAMPRAVRRVIARATAEDPSARFVDMAALLGALEGTRTSAARRFIVPAAGLAAVLVGTWLIAARGTATAVEDAAPPRVSDAVKQRLDRVTELDHSGDREAVMATIEEAIALAERTGDAAGLALARQAHGEYLHRRGRFEEAAAELELAFHIAVRVRRDDIAADAAINRASLLARELKRLDEAAQWARHIEASLGRAEGLDAGHRGGLEEAIGRIEEARGELAAARDRYRRAVELFAAERPRHDSDLATALSLLAQVEAPLGDLDDARDHLERAIEVATEVHGPDAYEVASARGNLAFVDREAGDYASARANLDTARGTIAKLHGAGHPSVIAIDSNLVALLMQAGRHEDAVASVERTLPRAPQDLPVTCVLQEQLGLSLRELGQQQRTREALRAAVACYDRVLGPGSQEAALAEADLIALAGD